MLARPMRGAEGTGAGAVGRGHRATTYTGVRGPEQPKGKGRRRERPYAASRSLVNSCAARDIQRPMHQALFEEDRDPTGLMGVNSTNSPDRAERPPTPPRSRRRDRRSYSPITSSSDEEPPQFNRKLNIEFPADSPDGGSLKPACNLADLTKSRRKAVVNGCNHLGEHDRALTTLFFPEHYYFQSSAV